METSDMKNIVVLKNLPSNIIDEAIVILKANKKVKQLEYIEKPISSSYDESVNKKDYVVKEAENVISNYISTLENRQNKTNNNITIEKKYKKIKVYSIVVSILLFFAFMRIFFA